MNIQTIQTPLRLCASLVILVLIPRLFGSTPVTIGLGAALAGVAIWWPRRKPALPESLPSEAQPEPLERQELLALRTQHAELKAITQQERERLEETICRQSERLAEQEAGLQAMTRRAEQAEAAREQTATQEAAAFEKLCAAETERQTLSDHIAVLADQLAGQVVVALAEAEQAISSAIEIFTRIADEAREAAEIAKDSLSPQSEQNVARIAAQATGIMATLIEGMLLSARQVSDSSQQLQRLVAVSSHLSELLGDIEGVADQTALVALNASIEAARAGESGRVFRVVATEIHKLAERSRLAAERMRALTLETSQETEAIYKSLAGTAETSLEASRDAQQKVDELLAMLRQADTTTQAILSRLSAKSATISQSHGSIVTAFQFHDLLRQRLEHVADPLSTLRDSLRGEAGDKAEDEALAQAVGETPRQVRAVGAAPTLHIVSYTENAEDDVTLF